MEKKSMKIHCRTCNQAAYVDGYSNLDEYKEAHNREMKCSCGSDQIEAVNPTSPASLLDSLTV